MQAVRGNWACCNSWALRGARLVRPQRDRARCGEATGTAQARRLIAAAGADPHGRNVRQSTVGLSHNSFGESPNFARKISGHLLPRVTEHPFILLLRKAYNFHLETQALPSPFPPESVFLKANHHYTVVNQKHPFP